MISPYRVKRDAQMVSHNSHGYTLTSLQLKIIPGKLLCPLSPIYVITIGPPEILVLFPRVTEWKVRLSLFEVKYTNSFKVN